MGKGDQRTKKGKRIRGSYGKSRPRNAGKSTLEQVKTHVEHDETLTKAEDTKA
jgi:30S ribosomal protein S31